MAVAVRVNDCRESTDAPPALSLRGNGGMRRFEQPELGGRNAGAQHPLGRENAVIDSQAAERAAQRLERHAGIEQRPEDHVAGRPGKAVEIERLAH